MGEKVSESMRHFLISCSVNQLVVTSSRAWLGGNHCSFLQVTQVKNIEYKDF